MRLIFWHWIHIDYCQRISSISTNCTKSISITYNILNIRILPQFVILFSWNFLFKLSRWIRQLSTNTFSTNHSDRLFVLLFKDLEVNQSEENKALLECIKIQILVSDYCAFYGAPLFVVFSFWLVILFIRLTNE